MENTTPSNCKEQTCTWNQIPPDENSQECIGCEGNHDTTWAPKREGEQP